MKKAFCIGSFDPITNGHIDIIKRGYKLFNNINILILKNINKKNNLFDAETRKEIIIKALKNENIKASVFIEKNLLVENIEKYDIDIIIKGLRDSKDFKYELVQNRINNDLIKLYTKKEIEYVYLYSNIENSYLSSSIVREIISYNGDISKYVPKAVIESLKR